MWKNCELILMLNYLELKIRFLKISDGLLISQRLIFYLFLNQDFIGKNKSENNKHFFMYENRLNHVNIHELPIQHY